MKKSVGNINILTMGDTIWYREYTAFKVGHIEKPINIYNNSFAT